MATDLYEILDISPYATPEEVRKAYRRKALETHPDRSHNFEDEKAAGELFRLVNKAYEVLNDEDNRQLYDEYGVWPPPTEQPSFRPSTGRDASGSFMDDPVAHDLFFDSSFHSSFDRRTRPFAFTDPPERFNSTLSNICNQCFFPIAPFFEDEWFSEDESSFANDCTSFDGDPFDASMLERSPFSGMLTGPAFPTIPSMSGSRVYSSSTQMMGTNGQWVSRSHTTRTYNGRTEVFIKEVDAQGNRHATYSSFAGERYTIDGVDEPSRGYSKAPRRSGSSKAPRRSGSSTSSHRPHAANTDARAFSASSRSQAPLPIRVEPPVVPPLPQIVSPGRRSSRRGHDGASTEDRRRSHTEPTYALMPTQYTTASTRDAPRESRHGHNDRALEREHPNNKLHREQRSSRHRHDHDRREPANTPVVIAKSTSGDSGRRGARARDNQQPSNLGWHGW